MLPVTDKDFHQEIEKYRGISIVDFWAEWCAPCKVFLPIVRDVSETIGFTDEGGEIPGRQCLLLHELTAGR